MPIKKILTLFKRAWFVLLLFRLDRQSLLCCRLTRRVVLWLRNLVFMIRAGCCIALDGQVGEAFFLFWCLISAIGLGLDVLHHIFVRSWHSLLPELLQVLVHFISWIHLAPLILQYMCFVIIRTSLKFIIGRQTRFALVNPLIPRRIHLAMEWDLFLGILTRWRYILLEYVIVLLWKLFLILLFAHLNVNRLINWSIMVRIIINCFHLVVCRWYSISRIKLIVHFKMIIKA